MARKPLILLVILSIVAGCTHKQYVVEYKTRVIHDTVTIQLPPIPIVPPTTTDPLDSLLYFVHTAGTPNYNLRRPNFVIIHHTVQDSCAQTFYTFSLLRTHVSAHYVICRDGNLHQLLNDHLRAWHAGLSRWGNITDMNSCSIGIELDNNGKEPFALPQITTLLVLLDSLKKTYNIPTPNFIGHADVAPVRKNDPSVYFPWKLLSDKGFGLWYDSSKATMPIEANFNTLEALHIIGYDVKDSTAAIIAFKRHFLQDTSRIMNEWDKRVLNSLYRKYL